MEEMLEQDVTYVLVGTLVKGHIPGCRIDLSETARLGSCRLIKVTRSLRYFQAALLCLNLHSLDAAADATTIHLAIGTMPPWSSAKLPNQRRTPATN